MGLDEDPTPKAIFEQEEGSSQSDKGRDDSG